MCDPVTATVVAVGAAAAGTAVQTVQAKKADKRAKEANRIAEKNASEALAQEKDATARRNQKKPNVAAILANNKNKLTNETALSGVGGVNSSQLAVGRNTLLGQ